MQFYQNKIQHLTKTLSKINSNLLLNTFENMTGGLTLDSILEKRLEIVNITKNVYSPEQIKKLSFSDTMELLQFYTRKINELNNERR